MKLSIQGLLLLIPGFIMSCQENHQAESMKPRTIITADGEVDDMDSFIRMLLYA
jgi:hypothetical protein